MDLNVVRRISIEAQVKGVDQASAGLNRLAQAQGGVADAAEKQEKSARSIEQAMERQRRSIEQSIRSQQQYADIITQQSRASQQLVAANDNVEESFTLMGIEAAEAAGHIRTAAAAAYAFSPAFREVVNGMAKPALSAAATALAAVATGMVLATNAAGRGLIELGLIAARSSSALAPLGGTIAMAGAAMAAFNPTVAAVSASILTRFMPAIRALSGIGIVINIAQMIGEAWELGGKQLEEYRQIAEKAAAVDLSTTFYQRLIKGAEAAKVPVEDLTRLLQNLQKAAGDALGGSALDQQLRKHLDAGNFGGNPGVQMLSQANTTQQRFEAIVTLINKAMQDGQRLAALDLAKTAFGPEVSDRLRQDSEYLDKILEQSKKIAETELVSAADIGRAVELQARYDAAIKLLEQRWHPIQDLLTQLGVRMHAAWVGIVEAIAQAFDGAARLVTKIGEIPQAFWDYVKRGANAVGNAAAAVGPTVPGIGTGIGIGGRLLAGATAQEEPRATDAYTQALDRLRAGLQNTKGVQQAVNETATLANRVYGDNSKTLDKVTAAAAAQKDGFDRAVDSAEKHISRMQADAKAVGLGAAALEEGRTRAMLWTAALQAGIPVVGKVAQKIDELAKRAAEAARELAKARIDQNIKFQRDTIGLSSEDVQIAQQLSAIYPKVADALASVEAQQVRVAGAQRQLADGFREVGKEMFSAFLSGKNVMDAMVRSLDNLAAKLANSAFDNILSGLVSGNLAQAGIGALQAGASALISAFTSDQKAQKELEEAKKRFAEMTEQVNAFNRAAAGVDLGPLTSGLMQLRSTYQQLAMAALEARDYGAISNLQETFNRGVVRTMLQFETASAVSSDLANQMKAVADEGAGLLEFLKQYGLANQGYIDSISASIARQQQELRDTFERGLVADIRSNSGVGYLNTIADAIKRVDQEAAQGVNPNVLQAWLISTAQTAINGAKLTGEAYQELIALYPQLTRVTHAFIDTQAEAAKAAADATQKLNLQLRLLSATTDTSTLGGALSLFDFKAKMERDAAIAAGITAENLLLLDQSLAAERANVVKDFTQKAIDEEKRLADARLGQMQRIQEYLDSLTGGSNSTLAPVDRLAAAQDAYQRQLGLARAGDANALGSITQYAEAFRSAGRDYYGSSMGYQDIFRAIQTDLSALMGAIGGGGVGSSTVVPFTGTATPTAPVSASSSSGTNLVAMLQAEIVALRGAVASLEAKVGTAVKDAGDKTVAAIAAVHADEGPQLKRTADAVVEIKNSGSIPGSRAA